MKLLGVFLTKGVALEVRGEHCIRGLVLFIRGGEGQKCLLVKSMATYPKKIYVFKIRS